MTRRRVHDDLVTCLADFEPVTPFFSSVLVLRKNAARSSKPVDWRNSVPFGVPSESEAEALMKKVLAVAHFQNAKCLDSWL